MIISVYYILILFYYILLLIVNPCKLHNCLKIVWSESFGHSPVRSPKVGLVNISPLLFHFFHIISNHLSHMTAAVTTPRKATRITEAESCGVVRVVQDTSNTPRALISPPPAWRHPSHCICALHLLETWPFPNIV